MNIIPGEAPIYGGGEILVEIRRHRGCTDEKFYLVFAGSEVRHVTPASAVWDNGLLRLRAEIPRHTAVESVHLSAYSSYCGEIRLLAEPTSFQYGTDSAHRMAIFLLGSVDSPNDLNDLELICRDRFQLSPDVQTNLDERLTSAFKTLSVPPCWNMMGTNKNGAGPAERLLHFSARLGLTQLSRYFLTLPGSREALSSPNHEGLLPEDLARKLGFRNLANLLQHYRKESCSSIENLSSSILRKEEIDPLSSTISTQINESDYDLEHDISKIEKLQNLSNRVVDDIVSDSEMKELHLTKNEMSKTESFGALKQNKDIVDNFKSSGHPPTYTQSRVLEDNLRRLRNIYEGVQKRREQNIKQIAIHPQKNGSSKLSSSCPTLSLDSVVADGDDFLHNAIFNMRSIYQRRTSLSSNSRSLDANLFDAINVKIHINDITPSVSQECLHVSSPVSDCEQYNSEKNFSKSFKHCKPTNIGGTASKRLAKRSNKKAPVRRQSWSSLGVGASEENDGRETLPRRWSLSSLDSDNEDTFCEGADCFQVLPQGVSEDSTTNFSSESPYNTNQIYTENQEFSKEKCRTLSSGNCEESVLSKSSKQSSSVPSMRDITTDIKENVEPEKVRHSVSLSHTAKNFLVSFRSHPLQKSLSTPTIAVDEKLAENDKQDLINRQSLCTVHPLPLHDMNDAQSQDFVEENKTAPFHHVSLASVLREGQLHSTTVDSDEDKPFSKRKKRSSIFFKKKPDKHKMKESKRTGHQFIPYHGNSVKCDACLKPFVKKQALKCENCLVIVHDSSCKDQVLDCTKFKLQMAQAKPSLLPVNKDQFVVPSINGTSSIQNKNISQISQSSKDKLNVSQFQSHTGIPMLCEAASKSSFINLGKMISEERDTEGGGGSSDGPSNITETNSASMESLDEVALELSDVEDNHVLRLMDEEPETWHATVDKKVFKKLKEREVKRQEAIYELIITEKHHCLTLQIMQKVYAQGMIRELNMSRDLVERLFPCLTELIELHNSFLYKLRERQSKNPIVEHIADILDDQFHDQRAERMQAAYGHFCSQHIEALNLYKELSKTDRKFQNFIKKCSLKRPCKTRGIPECLLLVTQRITKYILVVEALIKAAKDSKEEQETLNKVLDNLKEVISQVDYQVAEKERELRLLEILNKIDPKATIQYRGKKFKKTDLLARNQKLLKEGPLSWRSPRGKTIDVHAVMLSDLIFFVQENNQKYCFVSLENKPGIVSLQKLLVRKKAGQDSRGMYLISSNPNEPEIFELFCRTLKEQKAWMDAVREAVEQCAGEDVGLPSETEEERKLEAIRAARIKDLIALLHEKDLNLTQLCDERMRVMVDMLEVVGIESDQYENLKYSHLVENFQGPEAKELISAAISNATRLANSLYTSGTNLSRSVSSAGEHHSDTYVSPLLPKRAETFGGFDNSTKEPVVTTKAPALKKKLFHLKEHSDISSLVPSKVKIEPDIEESLESALRHLDSRGGPSRPPSICSSPDKQHITGNFLSPTQHPSLRIQKDITSELLSLTTVPLLMTQGKEQLTQIVELAHHLNTIICTVSHLSSAMESFKIQMSEANDKISKLTKEKEVRDRRPLYRPEHQLEELRNLQKQLNHDKAVWQQEKAQHETEMKTQKEELEKLQEQVKKEQLDVMHQRELLYRKLDALQKQGIILSPSHTVVNLNNCITRDVDAHKDDGRSMSVEVTSTTSNDIMQHRRTFSYDCHHENKEQPNIIPSGSQTAPVTQRQDIKSRPLLNSAVASNSKVVIPLHLSNSATNMQKRQSVSSQPIKQQLPLKLANTGNAVNGAVNVSSQGTQQVLPLKLALGSLPSSIPSLVNSASTKNVTPKRSHSAASSPSSTLTAPVHVRGGSSPALVQTNFPPNSHPGISSTFNKSENSILHQLKLNTEKAKNKRDRDSNEEIFC